MAMSTTRKVVLTIGGILLGLVLICVVGIAILVSALRGSRPSIRDNSVLALKISGALPDYVTDDPFRRLFCAQPQSLSSQMPQFSKAISAPHPPAALPALAISEPGCAKS